MGCQLPHTPALTGLSQRGVTLPERRRKTQTRSVATRGTRNRNAIQAAKTANSPNLNKSHPASTQLIWVVALTWEIDPVKAASAKASSGMGWS